MSKANPVATGFGAFVGRNWQWEDLVFGVEANYNYINSLAGSSASTIGPLAIVDPPGEIPPLNTTDTYKVTLTGAASAQIKDAITFRGRAGWATGDFLPYVFGGLAVGRMDVFRTVTSNVTKEVAYRRHMADGVTTTTTALRLMFRRCRQPKPRNAPIISRSAGPAVVGMEYMLWNNIFMRGEWEYIKFLSVMNTSITMNNVRAGIGYKF